MRAASRAAAAGLAALAGVAVRDLLQREHTVLRNFPVVGHARYLLEAMGPELRQYLVAGNNEERPFTRDQRRWVYASAKKENNYFGFGTDNDLEYTAAPDSEPKLIAEMLTTEFGRNARARPRGAPSTFAQGSATSCPACTCVGGTARPNVLWLMTGYPAVYSRSLSVPKPK